MFFFRSKTVGIKIAFQAHFKSGAFFNEFFYQRRIFNCTDSVSDPTGAKGKSGANAVRTCSFAGMPYDKVEASMRLFAAKALPTIHAIEQQALAAA